MRSRRRSGRRGRPLLVFGARHAADDRVDVGTLALDLVGVQASPCDAVVADAQDEDAALLKRRAVRLGFGPVNLREDGVAVDRRPDDLCVEVRDALQQPGPIGAVRRAGSADTVI
jgi:hypothetical protein